MKSPLCLTLLALTPLLSAVPASAALPAHAPPAPAAAVHAGSSARSSTPAAPAQARPSARSSTPAPLLRARVDALDLQAYQFDLELDRAAAITLACDEAAPAGDRLRLSAPEARTHHLTLRGLKAATRYECRVGSASSASGAGLTLPAPVSFITAPLPSSLVAPKVALVSPNPADTGYTLYNYLNSVSRLRQDMYVVIVDADANVRWYYRYPDGMQSGGGDLDATWLGKDRVLFGGDIGRNVPPTIIGLDKKVTFTGASQQVSPTDLPASFGHDCGPSEDGSSIFYINGANIAGVGSTTSDGRSTVQGFVIKELDPTTNKVKWFFDSALDGYATGGLPDPGASYPADQNFPNDPYHANAVEDHLENGRRYVYVGMRNNATIIKIDYQTKQVLWTLGVGGDFTLLEADGTPATGDDRWFFDQHDAHVKGNLVYMYDNGWDRNLYDAAPYTRALKLELNQQAMTARIVFEYTQPNWLEGIFGGYDLEDNGHALIAIGHTSFSSDAKSTSALLELDATGKPVWRANFTTAAESIYRADRIPGCDIFNNVKYCPTP